MTYAYEILPRPDHLGGGWRLRLLEDGQEVGGGVFPPVEAPDITREDALADAFADAEAEAYDWLDSRPGEE
ncbi:hypothetical protein [Janthinobacterium agaricidamnosum]|uniref:Uncharacterized protein n=1 Tax=Janthinobacterium agaricidamnosum NBRC 102515 = DSM 9628 TaxID=1349767 RepID=W0VBG5_9BURK|nr:hypothetical protein [Janthinobacterium agaricidamnosum]CDG86154.1 putative uncharacterized protein [Janthinobacterium agaricidamnosum NBRC 102515 = DSM 9628]